jgi:hypothetical protein
MPSKPNAVLAAVALSAVFCLRCPADDFSDKGREIFKKNQYAVVTVLVVQKTTYSAEGRTSPPAEARQDLTGTVIDPSGLTVLALSACDPSDMYKRMMSGRMAGYKVDTEVSDVKILLDDGTEIPSEIVLRDKDLDLAFIRPKTKLTNSMASVDLTRSGKAQILDQVITLNRLNKAAGRSYAASVERITAVVQKPRTFYIPDSTMTATALGSPAFTLDGSILGVNVMRTVGSGDDTMHNFRSEGVTAIFLPAEDILKAARQAPEAKGDAKPEEAKSPKDSPQKTDDKPEKK